MSSICEIFSKFLGGFAHACAFSINVSESRVFPLGDPNHQHDIQLTTFFFSFSAKPHKSPRFRPSFTLRLSLSLYLTPIHPRTHGVAQPQPPSCDQNPETGGQQSPSLRRRPLVLGPPPPPPAAADRRPRRCILSSPAFHHYISPHPSSPLSPL